MKRLFALAAALVTLSGCGIIEIDPIDCGKGNNLTQVPSCRAIANQAIHY